MELLPQRSSARRRAVSGAPRAFFGAMAVAVCLGALLAAPALGRNAYVVINGESKVAVIDTVTNQLVGTPFSTAPIPQRISITPDGRQLYVSHPGSNYVTVLDVAGGQQIGPPIAVGEAPVGIAITPDGRFAYVADNNSGTISVIDTQTRQVTKTILGFQNPPDIVITPDGKFAYVADAGDDSVSVIDVATNQVTGLPIPVGDGPQALAVAPDGRYVYVTNGESASVSVIDTATRTTVGAPIPTGSLPLASAITPDGATLYVSNFGSASVTVIDTATSTAPTSIPTGTLPFGIATNPDGRSVFVTELLPKSVSRIDTESNAIVATVPAIGSEPEDVVVAPNQPPTAAFAPVPVASPGLPVRFDASASTDPDGTIASYSWDFGDGSTGAGPAPSHVFTAPGSYRVKLTVTDEIGCSTRQIYDGHGALCNGGTGASQERIVTVANPPVSDPRHLDPRGPRVSVFCPKRALKAGCVIKVAAVARHRRQGKRKPRLTFETAVARIRLKRGKSRQILLVPKKAFRAELATANRTLVREVRLFKTRSGRERVVKLRRKPVF